VLETFAEVEVVGEPAAIARAEGWQLDEVDIGAAAMCGRGCCTAAAAPPPCTPARKPFDGHGDVRFSASAGPGLFDGLGHTRPFADAGEFAVGPHDTSWGIPVPADASTDEIADLIVAVTVEADAGLARFTDGVAAARAAMWTALAAAYPHAHTAQPPADLDDALLAELRRLLTAWLDRFWPVFHTPPAHLTARTGGIDGDGPG
jgi:hypothetical protein